MDEAKVEEMTHKIFVSEDTNKYLDFGILKEIDEVYIHKIKLRLHYNGIVSVDP